MKQPDKVNTHQDPDLHYRHAKVKLLKAYFDLYGDMNILKPDDQIQADIDTINDFDSTNI